ncbi:H-2 class II histocompatibility antigen, E-D beta chain-like [Melospiza melodia melodia]
MGRGAAAGALLAALVVLGAPPAAGAQVSGVFQEQITSECHFINGTEKMRYVERFLYNRMQFAMFDSDVGHYVGFTPYGEKAAKSWNSDSAKLEYKRAQVDRYWRNNYEVATPFLLGRRGELGAERVPLGPALSMTPEHHKTSLDIDPEPSALLEHIFGTS